MSKTETLRQLSDAANATRVEHLANQIEAVRQAKHKSAEDLARALEPLAQAMAELIDQTRATFAEVDQRTNQHGQQFQTRLDRATTAWVKAAESGQAAADKLNKAGNRMELKHYGLAVVTGLLSAVLTTVFWFWLQPPKAQNNLDAKAIAEYLRPALTEVLKRSNGK